MQRKAGPFQDCESPSAASGPRLTGERREPGTPAKGQRLPCPAQMGPVCQAREEVAGWPGVGGRFPGHLLSARTDAWGLLSSQSLLLSCSRRSSMSACPSRLCSICSYFLALSVPSAHFHVPPRVTGVCVCVCVHTRVTGPQDSCISVKCKMCQVFLLMFPFDPQCSPGR